MISMGLSAMACLQRTCPASQEAQYGVNMSPLNSTFVFHSYIKKESLIFSWMVIEFSVNDS